MANYNHTNVYANHPTSLAPNGDPIKLPENLETLPRAEHFPTQRHRWNTNEVSTYMIYDVPRQGSIRKTSISRLDSTLIT
ncbi:calmodulin-binding transcription activator 2-like isoform X5 [Vespula squamosa]|uniref:Calmodulin-binding transcription activator 2-like isoform X5 n=1 Tax=Vespula squamosa TaxID=30214 RepID=A0ABD2AQ58_VESSQ